MGAGGVIVPPEGYFPAIAAVCRQHDVLMISDEVICGFGRTGEWFGDQTLDFPPTSLSVAKQLTAGFLPLSAVALNKDMTEVIEANSGKIGTLGHGYTYGGHPVGCAVGGEGARDLPPMDVTARVRASPRCSRGTSSGWRGTRSSARSGVLGLMGGIELAPGKSPKGFAQPARSGRGSRRS